jgi:N-acetylglucosaminyldiphosphoundecaprenol N-acetyl-beta-D-mannosaminyltransferase
MIDKKVDVARLHLNALTKIELLQIIAERINSRQQTFIITPYSEFLFHALRDPKIEELFNGADLAVADGIGILWADYFLRQHFTFGNYYLKIIQAWWQVVWTGAAILLAPRKLYKTFPEKIVGADLFWDLGELAAKNDFSIFLLGGFADTTERVKQILENRFPGIRVVGTSNKNINDPTIIPDITAVRPEMLLVAFGPIAQEEWIRNNLKSLPVSMAIGLGGTFDYISGKKSLPPVWVRKIGLEWLYRLVTQPHRAKRIFNAVPGLILALVRYKIFISTPYRLNAVAIAVNSAGKILVVKRNPHDHYLNRIYGDKAADRYKDYWFFPQGAVEEGESVESGAARELAEETGLEKVELLHTSASTFSYIWNNTVRPLLNNVRHNKGQIQHVVYFRVADDAPIKLDNRELVDYKWADFGSLRDIVDNEKIPLAAIIQADEPIIRNYLEKQGKN